MNETDDRDETIDDKVEAKIDDKIDDVKEAHRGDAGGADTTEPDRPLTRPRDDDGDDAETELDGKLATEVGEDESESEDEGVNPDTP
jgi:hypothetical protein